MLTGQILRTRLLLLPVIAAAAGCSAPELGPVPAEKPASAYQAGQSFAVQASDWPEGSWWRDYHDPQLDQLVETAIKDSPTLAVAMARVTQAQGVAQQQGALNQPSLSTDISANAAYLGKSSVLPAPSGFQSFGEAALNFAYDFDFWGHNAALIAQAISQANYAEVQASQARLMLATSVAGAYADLATLYGDHDAAENALRVRTDTQTLVQQRFTLGLENRATVRQAEAAAAISRADLAANDESIALTKARLAVLIGAGPDRGLGITRPAIGALKPLGLPDNLAADLIGRRPDITAARLSAEASAEGIKAAKADYYPNINLAASVNAFTVGFNFSSASTVEIARAGPAIHLPIFDGGKRDGAYRTARGNYDEAVANYNQTVAQALNDVASAVISTKALSARLAATQQAVTAAAESHDLALMRYRGGLGNYLTVLTAEDALIADQRLFNELQARGFSLDINLVHALGGGFKSA